MNVPQGQSNRVTPECAARQSLMRTRRSCVLRPQAFTLHAGDERMRKRALICLAIAAACSLVLLPPLPSFMPSPAWFVGWSLLRAVALSAALLFQVASGGLDNWRGSPGAICRVCLAIRLTGGTLLVLVMLYLLEGAYYESVPFPYPILYLVLIEISLPPFPYPDVYLVLIRALSVCLMVGAFWPSRRVFVLGVAGALVSLPYFFATFDALHDAAQPWRTEGERQARLREVVPVMTALARVPPDAGVEPLLDFVALDQPHEAAEEAIRRIRETPDAFEQFSRLMDGPRSVDVLYVMTRAMGEMLRGMPETVEDRAWATAARLAGGIAGRRPVPTDEELGKLCLAVYELTYFRRQPWTLPERRRTDVMTVRDWVQTLLPNGNFCVTDSISPLNEALTRATR
jgi:hypothetical protein